MREKWDGRSSSSSKRVRKRECNRRKEKSSRREDVHQVLLYLTFRSFSPLPYLTLPCHPSPAPSSFPSFPCPSLPYQPPPPKTPTGPLWLSEDVATEARDPPPYGMGIDPLLRAGCDVFMANMYLRSCLLTALLSTTSVLRSCLLTALLSTTSVFLFTLCTYIFIVFPFGIHLTISLSFAFHHCYYEYHDVLIIIVIIP